MDPVDPVDPVDPEDPEDQVQDALHDDDDAPWYMGKAKDDFYRRQQAGPDIRSEEDPVEVKIS